MVYFSVQSNGAAIAPPLGKFQFAVLMLLMLTLPMLFWWVGPFEFYCWLLGEDGLYETAGAAACLVAGLLFSSLYCFPDRQRQASRNPWHLLFGLGSILLFFEEISWGQRLLGYETPIWLQDFNQANEATLHNLSTFQDGQSNLFVTVLGVAAVIYLVILPPLVRFSPRLAHRTASLRLPVPNSLFALGVLSIPLVLVFAQPIWIPQESGEVAESSLQIIWLLFAAGVYRHEHGERTHDRKYLGSLAIGAAAFAAILVNGHQTGQPVVGLASALGDHALRTDDVSRAAYYFYRALGVRPDDPELLTSLAATEFLANSPEHAIPLLEKALEIAPRQLQTLRLLALIHLQLDQPDVAGEYATLLCELVPSNSEAQYLLAVALFEQGNHSEAANALRAVLRQDPEHAGARQFIELDSSFTIDHTTSPSMRIGQ